MATKRTNKSITKAGSRTRATPRTAGSAVKKRASPARAKAAAKASIKAIHKVDPLGEATVVSSVELARRASERKAEADRRERLAAYRAELARSRSRGMRLGPSGELRVLAEGDSWFDYPLVLRTGGGVISHLQGIADVHILNMAHYGDEVRGMLGLGQRQRLEQLLGDRSLGTFDVLLFSGGGNDIAGDQMVLWLRAAAAGVPVSDALDMGRFRGILDLVEIGYRDLIAIRDRLSRDTHIVTHGYDIPQPSDKGVCGVGPWLKPSLDYCKWGTARDQFEIVRQMLGEFDTRLAAIAASTTRFTHVHTQGILDRRTDWHNELHPNRAGFGKIARAINNALAGIMPGHFTVV